MYIPLETFIQLVPATLERTTYHFKFIQMETLIMDRGKLLDGGLVISQLRLNAACPLAFVSVSIRGENNGLLIGALHLFFIYAAKLPTQNPKQIPVILGKRTLLIP